MKDKTVQIRTGDLHSGLRDVAEAWKRAGRGEEVSLHIVEFETWEGLTSAVTPERLRLLRHLHTHPARSVRALAIELGRDYSRVHGDVVALEKAGLIERSKEGVRATADRVTVELDLAAAE